jgi:osmoprotectant transport system ATP-binding protein
VIKFESVSKTFRDGTAAVGDLSLTAPTGKITVIVGPSGCGKTTTLRMVNRMLEPTSGRILWDGTPLKSRRKTTLRRQMGYVIQSGGLFPHRTVLENIGTVPGLLRWSKDKTRQRSFELLGSVGLDRKLASRYPAQLSGGQQQRVGVARALAADPLVLLMDEPFSAVDPVVRSELHEFFLGLQREISKTIILITHDIDEAIKLGDQVAILRVGGRLAQVGTPPQLLEEPADAFVEGFVGKDRGFRSLSFMPAGNLELEKVKVVRDVEAAGTGEPTLVVDADARPVGWANADRPGQVFPLGSTFKPASDTLRTALDSALTSLYCLAVAVDADTGRFAGVVHAQTILAEVADARVAAAESISIRAAESAMGRPKPSSAADKTEKSAPAEAVEPAKAKAEAGDVDNLHRPERSTESDADRSENSSKWAAVAERATAKKQDADSADVAEPATTVEDEPKAEVQDEKDADEQPEPATESDQEAKIITVVSGTPVDLRSAEDAATPRDGAAADDKPAEVPAARAPEKDPVR